MSGRTGKARIIVPFAAMVTTAVLLWPRVPASPSSPAPVVPPPPANRNDAPVLPGYVMNMAGGDIDLHSASGHDPMGPPVIADHGARLEVAVRGEREVKQKVFVRLYWRKGDRLQRWRPSEQYGPFSTFRYRGTGEVPFGVGLGDLVVVVSPFDDIPDQVHAAWLAHPPRHWQVMRQPVVWRAHGAGKAAPP
jgi:hypothetical protein